MLALFLKAHGVCALELGLVEVSKASRAQPCMEMPHLLALIPALLCLARGELCPEGFWRAVELTKRSLFLLTVASGKNHVSIYPTPAQTASPRYLYNLFCI